MSPGRRWSRARLGALGVMVAVMVFVTVFVVAVAQTNTTYLWPTNMISDLGDGECGVRGGRWICSPGHTWFNAGVIVTGGVLALSGLALARLWGSVLAGGLVAMGAGLVVSGVFPAGNAATLHLVGVILALLPLGFGLLLSGVRPQVAWLERRRVLRGTCGGVALLLCAESRLPQAVIPAGAGEVAIVACLLVALVGEAGRVLGPTRRVPEPVNR
jgi:hypothetical membrane protein